jgi:preprotein translocase subunit SecA
MGERQLADHIVDKALEAYRAKEERMAKPLYQVMKRITEANPENRPDKVQVIFTDGIRRMRIVVDVESALENEGREVARSLEKSAILSIIDQKWMEHLRELDSVKEGIGLRSFAQKDPLLEYKREAFDMFKMLLDEINQEAISLIWKAVPEVQAEDNKLEKAQKQKSRFDTSSMETQHADSTGMGLKAPSPEQQNGGQKPQGGNAKRQPVEVADEPGRNDYVTVQNMNTNETKEVKWKYAKRMVEDEGWIVVEK